MGNIVELKPRLSEERIDVDPKLVEAIEKFLERVKSGEVLSVALCAELRGEEIASLVNAGGKHANTLVLIGGLETLKARLIRMWLSDG